MRAHPKRVDTGSLRVSDKDQNFMNYDLKFLKVINVDHADQGMARFLETSGFCLVFNLYEMALDLPTANRMEQQHGS
jgi:hypothetical protein